jgi:hypothetical protein
LIAASSINCPTDGPEPRRAGSWASIASAIDSSRHTTSAAATAPKPRTRTALGSDTSVSRRSMSSARPKYTVRTTFERPPTRAVSRR